MWEQVISEVYDMLQLRFEDYDSMGLQKQSINSLRMWRMLPTENKANEISQGGPGGERKKRKEQRNDWKNNNPLL